MNIKKAIIPAAGMGTRFLPATKAIPKEMLPIIDIPTIEYIVREGLRAGIKEFLIIVNEHKPEIETHFGRNIPLEEFLNQKGKDMLINSINELETQIKVEFVIQKEQKGLGHAILQAKDFVNGEPFAVMLGDDVVDNESNPAIGQLCKYFEKVQSSIVGVQSVALDKTSMYGIVSPKSEFKNRACEIVDFVEKPDPSVAPSTLAVLGRYVLTPAIFDLLENQTPGKGNEIQLTDAIQRLIGLEKVYAYDFEGDRYDVGSKVGYVKATINYALKRDDMKEEVIQFMKEKLNKRDI